MYKVYQHKKADNDQIFYIGIAGNDKRPYSKNRSKLWKRTVAKHGYNVEIVSDNCSKEEAKQIERYLIAYYGRIVLNTGCLVNITDGGESASGRKLNKISRKKMSESAKSRGHNGLTGPKSKETKEKISLKNSKLTPEQVIFVRENYMPKHPEFSQVALGKKFNVHYTTIYNILKNRYYA
jgi:hypothetical protein